MRSKEEIEGRLEQIKSMRKEYLSGHAKSRARAILDELEWILEGEEDE